MNNLCLKCNNRRAWRMVKNFSNNPSEPDNQVYNVTPYQIAHKLLLNTARKPEKVKIDKIPEEEAYFFQSPFSTEELHKAVYELTK